MKKGNYVRNGLLKHWTFSFQISIQVFTFLLWSNIGQNTKILIISKWFSFPRDKKVVRAECWCKTLRNCLLQSNFSHGILPQCCVSFCTQGFAFLLCYSEGQVRSCVFFKVICLKYFLMIVFINNCVIVLLYRVYISALHFNELSSQDQAVNKNRQPKAVNAIQTNSK